MFSVWDNTLIFLVPAISLLLTLACVPAVRRLAAHWGCVALPKKDRWHSRPTPTLGGVAFYAGFVATAVLFSPSLTSALPFLLVVTLMFLVGIYDDLHQLNPATKLIGQIASCGRCHLLRLSTVRFWLGSARCITNARSGLLA